MALTRFPGIDAVVNPLVPETVATRAGNARDRATPPQGCRFAAVLERPRQVH